MEQRSCVVCEAAFMPYRRQMYCSKACGSRAAHLKRKAKPGYKEWKRADNAKRRGTELRARVEEFTCARCGKRCVPGSGVALHASRFCGHRCKQIHHRQGEQARAYAAAVADRAKAATRRIRVRRLSQGHTIRATTRAFVSGRCAICDASFTDARIAGGPNPSIYCSPRCAQRAAKERRRARERAAYVGPVNRGAVFERDNWTCQLCGYPVDRDAEVPAPMAPTIDHTLALANGGEHSMANAQCAHFMCNVRKGASQAA